jgi:integrase
MSVFKKGNVYHYRFMHRGQVVRRSTNQGDKKVAKEMEASHLSSLAKGDAGIFERKPAPTIQSFAKEFLLWVDTQFREKPRTVEYYHNGIQNLLRYPPLASLSLDDRQVPERLTGYVQKRQSEGREVSTINRELAALRRLLHIGQRWGRIESVTRIRMLPGERNRERVVTPAEEARYLTAADPLLNAIATVLFDTGLRPEECFRLRWEFLSWSNGRYGTLLVTHGKTRAARRVLPLTQRVRNVLETRWDGIGKPIEGWVWPAPTKSEHAEPSSLRKQHAKALTLSKVRPFVLYSARHSFLTRLGESGCDVWTLARIAGHSKLDMSARYVHPSNDKVLAAMEAFTGHVFGHGQKIEGSESLEKKELSSSCAIVSDVVGG